MLRETDFVSEFEPQEAFLESALKNVVKKKPADVLLLSGGIDSSLVAALDPSIPAITVTIEDQGIDVRYAQETTAFLGMNWHHMELSSKEALAYIPGIVQHLHSYDIGLLNDVALYASMRYGR